MRYYTITAYYTQSDIRYRYSVFTTVKYRY